VITTLLAALSVITSQPVISPEIPASYEIEAVLDDSTHVLTGSEIVKFVNPTSKPLDKIAFHLYPNAFKDTTTVFCSESDRIKSSVARGNIASMNVENIKLFDETIDSSKYHIDGTRLYIELDNVLPPERHIEISMDFNMRIPRLDERFGYDNYGNYILIHWFPILCGYQKDRLIDWEYHAESEFFSNFAYYDINIQIPDDFVLGSTGSAVKDSVSGSEAMWHARADSVITFAIACGPEFELFKSDTMGVKINYLINNKNQSLFDAADPIVKFSLSEFSGLMFPYPYEELTIVDFNLFASGIEQPGLIVVNFPSDDDGINGQMLKATLAHEIAHQWFYACLATNEFEEAWLDEGFTSYLEYYIGQEAGYNKLSLIFSNYFASYSSMERLFTLYQESKYPINLKSWEYPNWQSYSSAVYGRAWFVIQALHKASSDSLFFGTLKDFANEYRFKHPDQSDLQNFIDNRYEQDMSRFFDQFISGTARVDYSIESINFSKVENVDVDQFATTVRIERKLDGVLPQTVTIVLENGETLSEKWDGVSRIEDVEFISDSRPVYATLDHEGSYFIDENLNNNSLYLDSNIMRLISFEWDIEFIFEFLMALFL
jgi:hypothetical protein